MSPAAGRPRGGGSSLARSLPLRPGTVGRRTVRRAVSRGRVDLPAGGYGAVHGRSVRFIAWRYYAAVNTCTHHGSGIPGRCGRLASASAASVVAGDLADAAGRSRRGTARSTSAGRAVADRVLRTVGGASPDRRPTDVGQVPVAEEVRQRPELARPAGRAALGTPRPRAESVPGAGRHQCPLVDPRASRGGPGAGARAGLRHPAPGGGALAARHDRQRDRLARPVAADPAPPRPASSANVTSLSGMSGSPRSTRARYSPVAEPECLGHRLGRPLRRRSGRRGSRRPGPRSTIQSAVLMTSRLCSMTRTVLPWSTSRWRTWSSFSTSAKWRPVVGSSSR